MTDRLLGSVVIPAHNESSVIERCLDTLLEGFAPGDLQVVVACNGCTDDTAVRARRDGVHVLEVAEASKSAALRAADLWATSFPRIYLDADVVLTSASAQAVLAHLRNGTVLAARPPIQYETSSSSRLVQRYYRARSRMPAVMGSLWGAGVFALAQGGRERFTVFPDVLADDLFVDQLFTGDEIAVVDCPAVLVHVPRRPRDLVRVLRRTYRGVKQVAPHGAATTGGSVLDLSRVARSGVAATCDALVYAGFAVAGRLAPATDGVRWERDEGSRVAQP